MKDWFKVKIELTPFFRKGFLYASLFFFGFFANHIFYKIIGALAYKNGHLYGYYLWNLNEIAMMRFMDFILGILTAMIGMLVFHAGQIYVNAKSKEKKITKEGKCQNSQKQVKKD
jgi:hypothetical protein